MRYNIYIMVMTLIPCCILGCGQDTSQEPVIFGAPVSTMTEEAAFKFETA